MKSKTIFFGILFFIFFGVYCYAQQDDFPVLKDPYLGQKPPGITPEIFALDESYLIYCSKMLDGYGAHDLYITFRKQDGSWTKPVNMGEEMNSSSDDWIPYVTSDGKYFFFTSNRAGDYDIYWVDTKIIEQLKPKELKKRRTL